jgi:hypothetical protein
MQKQFVRRFSFALRKNPENPHHVWLFKEKALSATT